LFIDFQEYHQRQPNTDFHDGHVETDKSIKTMMGLIWLLSDMSYLSSVFNLQVPTQFVRRNAWMMRTISRRWRCGKLRTPIEVMPWGIQGNSMWC